MASSFVEVIETVDKSKDIARMLKFIKDNEVLVGIPQKRAKREGEPVTNAELLFIHTNGSPINNIPARPVIEPAIAEDRDRISDMLKKSANLALEGDETAALQQLKLTGIHGQNISRAWFTNPKNNWPPNSPTVQRRKERKGSTDPKPLIDTGELRRSITYVVIKRGDRVT